MAFQSNLHAGTLVCAALAFQLALPRESLAVLFDATGDPSYNTTPPTGALTNSGWQYQGKFGVYLGTSVAPHYFLTARHFLGSTNWGFYLDGTNYHPTAYIDDPATGSDLRLWRVADRLPRYAPVYTGSNEVGAAIAVFGRGTQRSNAVVTAGLTNGWYWGADDNVMRWGSNQVDSISTNAGAPYLYATFKHDAGPDECDLSGGDSGGASFILADGVWQLAGIHWSVDGYFNFTNSIVGDFNAAIYDGYELYVGSGTNWTLIPDHEPAGFYSSRVSAHYAWLASAIPDFDSNANGLPDWWELQYSGNIHGMSPTDDPDGDGMNNLAEWIARTDPTNAASYFQIEALACSTNLATLTFTGWSDRLYNIFYHDAPLTNGFWTLATTNAFAGADGPTLWSDTDVTAAVTSRFYRVEALLPP